VSEISGAELSAYLLIVAGLVWVLVGFIGLKATAVMNGKTEIGLKTKAK
jgi:hypothetical protein